MIKGLFAFDHVMSEISTKTKPIVKSLKQRVRLWFEFYKLACADPSYAAAIKQSKNYYSAWGDVLSVNFDTWWRDHQHLFPPSQVEVVLGKSHPQHVNTLTVVIPLNQSETLSISQLRTLIKRHKADYEAGKTFSFTKANFNSQLANESLELYRFYVMQGRPSLGKDFVMSYVEHVKLMPRKNWLPTVFRTHWQEIKQGTFSADGTTVRKELHRRIKTAEIQLHAAAVGRFPGKLS